MRKGKTKYNFRLHQKNRKDKSVLKVEIQNSIFCILLNRSNNVWLSTFYCFLNTVQLSAIIISLLFLLFYLTFIQNIIVT